MVYDFVDERKLRTASRPGMTAVILNRKRVLILKRINLPFIINPGIWYFVGGSRKKGETPLQNAYREIGEELALGRERLTVLSRMDATIVDRRRRERWRNSLFIISSSTREVRLNVENSGYRWVTLEGLRGYKDLLGSIENAEEVLVRIKSALKRT